MGWKGIEKWDGLRVCVYEHAYLNLIFTFLSITNVFTNGCIDYLEDGFGEI